MYIYLYPFTYICIYVNIYRQDDDKSSELKIKSEESTVTDSEATALCTEWKSKYSVVQGVSWGNLPYDLQQKWLTYSCDYHFKNAEEGKGTGADSKSTTNPAEKPSKETWND